MLASLTRRNFLTGLFILGLLCISAFSSRIWYDDTGHWRVTKFLFQEGEIAYPLKGDPPFEADPASQFITCGPLFHFTGAAWMHLAGTGFHSSRILILIFSGIFLFLFLTLSSLLTQPGKAFWALLLLGLNLQFLTYGANYLGEIPMLLFLFVGMYMLLRYDYGNRNWMRFALAGLAFGFSALEKEYVFVPLFLFGIFWMLSEILLRKRFRFLLTAFSAMVIAALVFLAGMWMRFDDFPDLIRFFIARQEYKTEFFAFRFSESLPFLMSKPLILLGSLALVLRCWVKDLERDKLFLLLQVSLLLFFLAGAGLDRLGMLLIPIPAIYLAEFCQTAWDRWANRGKRIIRIPVFALLFLILFSQTTFLRLGERLFFPETVNTGEKWAAAEIQRLNIGKIFTFDEQLLPFLNTETAFRLYALPPWFVKSNPHAAKIILKEDEYFISGPYGTTEYHSVVDWESLVLVSSGPEYAIWKTAGQGRGSAFHHHATHADGAVENAFVRVADF